MDIVAVIFDWLVRSLLVLGLIVFVLIGIGLTIRVLFDFLN